MWPADALHYPLVNLDSGLEKSEEEGGNELRLRDGKRGELSSLI